MASIVFYFQVHQPNRLKPYSVFHTDPFYFDDQANRAICEKVAEKCYRPMTRLLIDLVNRHEGNFRVSFSLTGTVIDQMQRFTPDVVDLFCELAETGCCEFLGETYYHSLAFLYSYQEFKAQVDMHTRRIQDLFDQTPVVFRNTELIYSNQLAQALSSMCDLDGNPRWMGAVCEGLERHLGYRSPNYVYRPPMIDGRVLDGRPRNGEQRALGLLLKNYKLSDDIAFRFGNKGWEEWPLSAERFVEWVHQINGDGYLCNLFMDYETFGEHQWADTGIFSFMEKLPEALFDYAPGENHFCTPAEAFEHFDPVGEYDVHEFTSWADSERDLTAWRGNAMQVNALEETYRLERLIGEHMEAAQATGDPALIDEARHVYNDWRKLTTSDHYYYMCTKFWADGDVHKYFSPYDSPYDSYINYMNVLDNVRARAARLPSPSQVLG